MSWEQQAGLSQLDRVEESVDIVLASMAPWMPAMSAGEEVSIHPRELLFSSLSTGKLHAYLLLLVDLRQACLTP